MSEFSKGALFDARHPEYRGKIGQYILCGSEFLDMKESIREYAYLIEKWIKEEGGHMLPRSSKEIYQELQEVRGAILLGPDNKTVIGYSAIHMWQLQVDDLFNTQVNLTRLNQQNDTTGTMGLIGEFGGLILDKKYRGLGLANDFVKQVLSLLADYNNCDGLISIVTNDNTSSLRVMYSLGLDQCVYWHSGDKFSQDRTCVLEDWPYTSFIFDLGPVLLDNSNNEHQG